MERKKRKNGKEGKIKDRQKERKRGEKERESKKEKGRGEIKKRHKERRKGETKKARQS